MDQDVVEKLIAAQLAAGMLGIVLNPEDEVEEMAATSVQLYRLVLSEVRKHGTAPSSNVVSPLSRRRRGTDR